MHTLKSLLLAVVVVFPTTQAFAQPAPTPDTRPGDTRPGDIRPGDPRPPENRPVEKRADLMGRVIAATDQSITVLVPARPAEGQPPAREPKGDEIKINLTDRSKVLYFGVDEGQAKPAPGLFAMVWLEENSKDNAARVRLMKREGEERPDIQGRILAVSPDGKALTLETRDPERPADKPTGQSTIRLAPYTQSQYYGVEKDAARPTAGYQVVAWFEKGSKETVARIKLMKADQPTPQQ